MYGIIKEAMSVGVGAVALKASEKVIDRFVPGASIASKYLLRTAGCVAGYKAAHDSLDTAFFLGLGIYEEWKQEKEEKTIETD